MTRARNLLAHTGKQYSGLWACKVHVTSALPCMGWRQQCGQHCPPCSTYVPQQVHLSWMQVLVTAASAEQYFAGIQVPAMLTYSASMLFCKGFAISAQLPSESLHLAPGVAWGHFSPGACATLFILCLLLDHRLFLCEDLVLGKMRLLDLGTGFELRLKDWDSFYTNNWVVQRLWG